MKTKTQDSLNKALESSERKAANTIAKRNVRHTMSTEDRASKLAFIFGTK
jgi:hypothetical protein